MSCKDDIKKTRDNTLLIFDKSYFYLEKEKLIVSLTKFWLIYAPGFGRFIGSPVPEFLTVR